jgi:hypothetical protein
MIRHFIGHILNKELPADIEKAAEGEFWAVATAEVIDRSRDIVRVEGMSLEMHSPESPIKLIAQHLRKLPDGTSPVLGSVREFKQASINKGGTNVKALLFKAAWADSPLAKHYRSHYEQGHMTDFSIGAAVKKATPIKGGGTDYEQTMLAEISCVTIGDNPAANTIIMQSLGDEIEPLPFAAELKSFTPDYSDLLNQIKKELEPLHDRLDVIESALAVKPEAETPVADDRKESANDITRRKQMVKELLSLLGN